MKRTVLLTFLGLALTAQNPPSSAKHPMPGAPVASTTDTPVVREAKAFVQKHLAILRIKEVKEASTQVVAGLNVKLVCRVAEEEGSGTWEFHAYRKLDGHWRLQSAQRIGD